MSYQLLYLWLKWIFGILIALGLYFEFACFVGRYLHRRATRKAPEWVKRDLAKRGIYIEGPPDPSATRGSLQEFKTIQRMYPK